MSRFTLRSMLSPVGTALVFLMASAHLLGAAAAPPPSRPLDLLVVAAPAGGAGKVAGLVVRCWERTTAQDAMHGQMLSGALGMAGSKDRQVTAREVGDLATAGGAASPHRACGALASSVRKAGGTVSYQPVAGDRNRCVVGGLSPEAMGKLFATCFDF
jgi:hypothetical protein